MFINSLMLYGTLDSVMLKIYVPDDQQIHFEDSGAETLNTQISIKW